MPESKSTGPEGGGAQERLSEKTPPKPRQPASAIPAALVSSKTALRRPPAPRPPRPTGTRPRSSAPNDAPSDRTTERPVSTEVPRAPNRDGRSSQRLGALLALAAAGVLGGAGWYFTRAPAEAPEVSAQRPKLASNVAATEDRESAPEGAAIIDLDQEAASLEGQSQEAQEQAEPKEEPKLAEAQTRSPAPEQPRVPVPERAARDSATNPSEPAASPAAVEQAAIASANAPRDERQNPAPDAQQEAPEAEPATPVTPQPVLPPFDTQAAKAALTAMASQASSCRVGDDPRGTAEVLITFAPSGRVTSANVAGPPLRGAKVPPFSGDHVTVRKLVTIH